MAHLPRRSLALALTGGAATALILTGCASGGGTAAPSATDFSGVSLTVWNTIDYDPYQSLQKQYFEDCADQLGVTVDVQTITDSTSKYLQAASSKSFPDIAQLSTDVQLPLFASQGVLADLGALGVTTDGQTDSVADLGTYDGTLYGVTTNVEDYVLFYDKAAFAAAGITEPPATFEELVADAKALTSSGEYGIVLPGEGTDGAAPVYFLPFLLSAGGDPAEPTSDGAVAAVDLYKQLFDDGSLSKEFVNWGWDSSEQWTGQKAAIQVSGPWNLVDTSIPFEYGTAPIPTLNAGEDPQVTLLGYTYGVAASDDANKQAAAAALLQCRASEENQLETAVQGGYIPALTSAQESFVEQVPAAQSFVDAIPNAFNAASLGTDWNELQQVYVAAIQNATVNGVSAKDALAEAAPQG